MSIINDFSFIGPFLIKSIILFLVIGACSIIPNKITYHEPGDDE